jgi:hypothetical protein
MYMCFVEPEHTRQGAAMPVSRLAAHPELDTAVIPWNGDGPIRLEGNNGQTTILDRGLHNDFGVREDRLVWMPTVVYDVGPDLREQDRRILRHGCGRLGHSG